MRLVPAAPDLIESTETTTRHRQRTRSQEDVPRSTPAMARSERRCLLPVKTGGNRSRREPQDAAQRTKGAARASCEGCRVSHARITRSRSCGAAVPAHRSRTAWSASATVRQTNPLFPLDGTSHNSLSPNVDPRTYQSLSQQWGAVSPRRTVHSRAQDSGGVLIRRSCVTQDSNSR